jgi:hypothetical protein
MTDRRDLGSYVAKLRVLVDQVQAEGHELLRRAAISSARDGYPATASGADRSSVSTPLQWLCIVCGEEGAGDGLNHLGEMIARDQDYHHVEVSAAAGTDYADPTARAAIAGRTPDEIAAMGRRFLDHVRRAETSLVKAALELNMAKPNPKRPVATDDQWCSHHLAHGMTEVLYRLDLCRRCYDFQLAERVLPPFSILQKWARGERVYDADIRKSLGNKRRRAAGVHR